MEFQQVHIGSSIVLLLFPHPMWQMTFAAILSTQQLQVQSPSASGHRIHRMICRLVPSSFQTLFHIETKNQTGILNKGCNSTCIFLGVILCVVFFSLVFLTHRINQNYFYVKKNALNCIAVTWLRGQRVAIASGNKLEQVVYLGPTKIQTPCLTRWPPDVPLWLSAVVKPLLMAKSLSL